jgi:hypothetical protein
LTVESDNQRAFPTTRVLSRDTFDRLDELRRFKHFKRYYYRLEFDWNKLDFLLKKTHKLHPSLREKIEAFRSFLEQLEEQPQ